MARQIPTPSPSPSPPSSSVETPTLPVQINAATQKQHILLNRLIVERLPLALPPQASNLVPYGLGIASFAQIFYAFEGAWDELTETVNKKDCPYDAHALELRRWLATLRPDGLARSTRLDSDLEHISTVTGVQVGKKLPLGKDARTTIRIRIQAKPHILIAYSWVMYMAIFSGGRWIRQQLLNSGEEFWTGQQANKAAEKYDALRKDVPGLSFLSFDGEEDGEDIKRRFKARLAEAEARLTPGERQEVISTAVRLFDDCIQKVLKLDEAVKVQAAQRRDWRVYGFAASLTILLLVTCYRILAQLGLVRSV